MPENISSNTRRILFSFLFVFTVVWSSNAQTNIEGQIVEKGTNKPIQFANIGVIGTFVGTATDENGQYKLLIPLENMGGKLKVSVIGYEPYETVVSNNIYGKMKLIELAKTSYSIQEVSIDAQSQLLYGRLKKAIQKIPQNYITSPLNMLAEYSQSTQSANEIKTCSGELLIYDNSGYRKQSLIESYRDINYQFNSYQSTKNIPPTRNGLTDVDFLLHMDLVRQQNLILNEDAIQLYNLKSEKDTLMYGEPVWRINFTTKTPNISTAGDPQAYALEGNVYIGQKSLIIYQFNFHVSSSCWNLNDKSMFCSGKGSYKAKDINYIYEVNYSKQNDKMALSLITLRSSYKDMDQLNCNEATTLRIKTINTKTLKPVHGRSYFVSK